MRQHHLTPRTIAVLKHIQAATGRGKRGTNRSAVAIAMALPRAVVSSIFTRLENNHLIERMNVAAHVATDQKLNFKVTSAGVDAINLGSGALRDKEIYHKHSGAYSKATKASPTPSNLSTKNVMTLPVYQPPRNDPPRADANQHLNFKSRGFS